MALTEITCEAVLKAFTEYQERGREKFLSHYGYREARSEDEGIVIFLGVLGQVCD
ncbi:hypothetical protein [Actinomadura sp. K4S16]|uniref:hypothetical protein n=1 Tax=Actinomadura sp. K4S16 TaxID=1316147 RepID=UPI001358C464|nr:hypothetical protein [Actinomadura sp. K4S16]